MDEMNRYFEAGLMLGRFHSMTQGERMELRVRRMMTQRNWRKKVVGTERPERIEPVRPRWPDVPEAAKERYCDSWFCTKKVPAGWLVCPWCGRMETAPDFNWLDALYMPRETVYMGNGVCKTVFRTTGRDGHGMITEQYSRSPVADLELKAEFVTEVPTETARGFRLRRPGGSWHSLGS